jgi:hypothetical protein
MYVSLVNVIGRAPITHSTGKFSTFENVGDFTSWALRAFSIAQPKADVCIFTRDGLGEDVDPLKGQWIHKRPFSVFNHPREALIRVADGVYPPQDYLFEFGF